MKVIDLAEHEIKKYVESKRPPEEMRNQIDIGYTYKNKAVELFEIRPKWDEPSVIDNHPFARAKYVKTQNIWKLYWIRANGKWETYQPNPEIKNITELIEILENDKTGCFWG